MSARGALSCSASIPMGSVEDSSLSQPTELKPKRKSTDDKRAPSVFIKILGVEFPLSADRNVIRFEVSTTGIETEIRVQSRI